MDITPLYELRERLKMGAVAGTNLIAEDFRLKRAVEAIEPLEKVSPVFAKIGQLAKEMLDAECPNPSGALLDTLSLVDAVLCTQGLTAVTEETEEIPVKNGTGVIINAPYSVLSGLIDAFTNAGGGRYSLVLETHKEHPELFSDYRVRAAMVKSLGASYAELAEKVSEWLKEEREAILPLLQSDFDPKGKKEMVRRIEVMEAVSGAGANHFYLEQLENAQKEVRAALIYALRHDPQNTDRLLELAKTEKGSSKKMAHWALAQMEYGSVQIEEFWRKMIEKTPDQAMEYLSESTTDLAGNLMAEQMEKLLSFMDIGGDKIRLSKETAQKLQHLLFAVLGKSGQKMCACYRKAAGLKKCLDGPLEGEQKPWEVSCPGLAYGQTLPFSKAVPSTLCYSLLLHPDRELIGLAEELYEEYGTNYFSAALTAKLFSQDSKDCYVWCHDRIVKKGIFGAKIQKEMIPILEKALLPLYWDKKRAEYVFSTDRYFTAGSRYEKAVHNLYSDLDPEWYELLKGCGNSDIDKILGQLIHPDYAAQLGAYFYKKSFVTADNRLYLPFMRECGWTQNENLAVHYCKSRGKLGIWEITNYLSELPGSSKSKAEEGERVIALIEKKEITLRNGNLTQLKQFILDLHNQEVI